MHIQCSSSVFTTALDMKLIILVGLIACSYADKLDRTYLPPASAGTAGGSPGSLTAPGAFNPQSSLEGLGQQTFGQNPQTGSNFGQAPSQSSFGQGPKVGSNIGQTPSQSNFGQNQGSIGTPQSNFGSNLNQGSIDTAFGQPSNIDNSNIAQPERERASVDRNAEILRYDNENDGNNFAYSFETSNGIAADESGTAANGVQAQGGFSYTGDDGQQYSIRYTADENGYLPQGDHLPTPHPIPEEILKSIEKNAEAAAAGTQEGAYNPDEDSNDIGGNGYNDAAPSFQSGQIAPGVSAGVNGPSSFGPGSQTSNTQGYPRGPASAGPQRPQGSQTGPGSSPFGSPNQGYPTGPAQAQPTPFGSQGSATQQGQPQFTAPGSAPSSDQGYPRGPAQSPSSGSQTPQNVQRPTSLFGTPSGSDQVSGPQGYPRGPANPSQSSPSGFPSQSGQGPFGTPSTTGPSGPQGYPSGPSQSNPSSPFGSQGQSGPSRFGTPSAPSSEGYPRGPASSQPASQGFPSQRGPTPSTDYTPSASSPSRFNQQQGSNQIAPSAQGGDAGYQYNRPTGPSGQSQPNNQASFPSTQYGTPTQDAARPTSQGFLNNQRPSLFGSPMLPTSSRPQNTPQSSQAPTASQGYPQNSPRPTSQYGVPASDKPQFNAPSSSPIPSRAPAFSQTNPQFGASSTVSTIRPTSGQNFGQSGPAVQPQDESGYQYNRPQTQFGDSRPSAAGPLSGPSAPQGTRPSFASNIPTGPTRGPQGSSRPTGPAETGYPSGPSSTGFPSGPSSTSFPSGPSSTGYPSGPASTGSRPESFRPSSPTGSSGFSRPNTAAENIQGNFGSPSGPMPQSAPYKYDAPQNTAGPTGPQSTFGSARPNQVGSFGQPGQNRPGVTGPSGQERPGQEFGGPRQPPSFSSEEGYKY